MAGAVNPHDGATLRASRPAVTEAERVSEPDQSRWRHGLARLPAVSGTPGLQRAGAA